MRLEYDDNLDILKTYGFEVSRDTIKVINVDGIYENVFNEDFMNKMIEEEKPTIDEYSSIYLESKKHIIVSLCTHRFLISVRVAIREIIRAYDGYTYQGLNACKINEAEIAIALCKKVKRYIDKRINRVLELPPQERIIYQDELLSYIIVSMNILISNEHDKVFREYSHYGVDMLEAEKSTNNDIIESTIILYHIFSLLVKQLFTTTPQYYDQLKANILKVKQK